MASGLLCSHAAMLWLASRLTNLRQGAISVARRLLVGGAFGENALPPACFALYGANRTR
jgi:hypothetical protein